MKLKIHVCTEDGELLESVETDISTNPADIRSAKLEAGEAIEQAVRVLLHRAGSPTVDIGREEA